MGRRIFLNCTWDIKKKEIVVYCCRERLIIMYTIFVYNLVPFKYKKKNNYSHCVDTKLHIRHSQTCVVLVCLSLF